MPTLGTQNISDSYPQLLKTFGTGGLDGNLQIVTDGDNTSSALKISTTGVNSSGSLSVDGATTLTGAVTFGTSITASTGTATLGTATISTATISTATISTATIPTILGATTFASTITASTGTNTLGTINTNTATIGTLTVTSGASVATTATVGTAKIGTSGPSLTAVSYGTAAFTSATAPQYNSAQTTTGTFGLTGLGLNDIIIGTINSLGSATGTVNLTADFHVVSSGVARYVVNNGGNTAGTIPAGTIFATAMRFTA
jgi:hypothetical protein